MVSVKCPNCRSNVRLPSGLKFAGVGDNPAVKGVSCPFCYENGEQFTIPAEVVEEAITDS